VTDTRTLAQLISELRLVEREDGGSTRAPGSERAGALAAEIERRLEALRSEGEGFDWIANILDGRA
jgi:hypothetical protein